MGTSDMNPRPNRDRGIGPLLALVAVLIVGIAVLVVLLMPADGGDDTSAGQEAPAGAVGGAPQAVEAAPAPSPAPAAEPAGETDPAVDAGPTGFIPAPGGF